MGYSFFGFMKRIGIFLICAQSFLHFTAGKSYEKYIKLLIGVMVLGQFLVPVRAVFLEQGRAELWEEIDRFQEEMEAAAGSVEWTYREEDTAVYVLEKEIREKLEKTAEEYGYIIKTVAIDQELPRVEVIVAKKKKAEGKIQVGKIEIGHKEKGQSIEEDTGPYEEMQRAFGDILNTNEAYILVEEE